MIGRDYYFTPGRRQYRTGLLIPVCENLDDLGGGFEYVFLNPYLGRWSNMTNIFQRGWNHQLDDVCETAFGTWKDRTGWGLWPTHWRAKWETGPWWSANAFFFPPGNLRMLHHSQSIFWNVFRASCRRQLKFLPPSTHGRCDQCAPFKDAFKTCGPQNLQTRYNIAREYRLHLTAARDRDLEDFLLSSWVLRHRDSGRDGPREMENTATANRPPPLPIGHGRVRPREEAAHTAKDLSPGGFNLLGGHRRLGYAIEGKIATEKHPDASRCPN